ncbi:unnamed protein product [Kuraishia capsulata CBS 1993]|uniref:Uncharacterized protein n=1 Tax=Kuraishia capsulata CBS 1993 TaxID=1382522 RepID=W6MU12_9ASCO|nr:uncharacterized protein KUCA_T00004792001 [Kuraishia capsulata CBS 1993]CDK28807.1 unnamed protein product [Kuraishia capsulata CBS 1993]
MLAATDINSSFMTSTPQPPFPLVRGKSSSSLKDEGKKRLVKKFTAGKVMAHNRNNSYGKNLNKLTRITSLEPQDSVISEDRPKMNRSKSSDLILSKSSQRSRSSNKLNTLASTKKSSTNLFNHPLNRPRSRGSKVIIEFSDNKQESDEDEEEVEDFNDNVKVLGVEQSRIEETPEPDSPEEEQNDNYTAKERSDILTAYNSGFLLSQSTGVERPLAVNSVAPHNHNLHNLMLNNKVSQAGNYFGLSAKRPPFASRLSSRGSLNQVEQTFTPAGSEPASLSNQSSQLIFQPSSTGLNKEISHQDRTSDKPSIKDFSDFLSTKSSSVETRTQQKLWLQRESALLPSSGDSSTNLVGAYATNSQFRTEFEKFAREYLNVRRYVNPTVESLKRIDIPRVKLAKNRRAQDIESVSRENSAFAFQQRQDSNEVQKHLARMWQNGCNQHLPQKPELRNQDRFSSSLKSQRDQEGTAFGNVNLAMTQTALASPQAPTTRAQAARGQLTRTNTAPGMMNGAQVHISGKMVSN